MSRIPSPEIFITIDLRPLVTLKSEYEKRSAELWNAVGRRHRMMVYRRFIALSAGAGQGAEGGPQWPPLAHETLKSKRYKQKRFGFSGNINWILRLSSKMVHAIDYIVRNDGNGYHVGFVKDKNYPRAYSKYTVLQLADIHHKGIGVPRRPVIVMPGRREFKELMTFITGRFGHMIRSANRNVRR
jgi:hypothetical protein